MAESQDTQKKPVKKRPKFPPTYWLVILFEFFERGSYYGMMSILSVYFTDELFFRKESVGIIKSTIQPLLYFLPIISGALADRFGYRKMLTMAFAFLGLGYFLTARVTDYGLVFLALVVMGVGAGLFKPIISGTIARTTDETNSTLGFGIFYWTINLGAFLFPLILVPLLKSTLGTPWVIYAAAIGTGSMLIPTLLLFREPKRRETEEARLVREKKEREEPVIRTIITTVANAFEIIYSPIVLIFQRIRHTPGATIIVAGVLIILLLLTGWSFTKPREISALVDHQLVSTGDPLLLLRVERDQLRSESFAIRQRQLLHVGDRALLLELSEAENDQTADFLLPLAGEEDLPVTVTRPERWADFSPELFRALQDGFGLPELSADQLDQALDKLTAGTNNLVEVTCYKPDNFAQYGDDLVKQLKENRGLVGLGREQLANELVEGNSRVRLKLIPDDQGVKEAAFRIITENPGEYSILLNRDPSQPESYRRDLLIALRSHQDLRALSAGTVDRLLEDASSKPFFLLFVCLLISAAVAILFLENRFKRAARGGKAIYFFAACLVMVLCFWVMPGLTLFARILSTVIFSTVLSLFIIKQDNPDRFQDHFRFLLMIFLYSGFWILYFQMFDSVLWYMKAYVDASPLNSMINSALGILGVNMNWRFDVEHVTVINAGTIILLQLAISNMVKNTKALPTMIVGIGLGTLGMAILAISTGIWVLLLGIGIFSIGEMTAHPKFISYIGQTAPEDKKAMYMGYIFLYGVIGSSIGGVLGANLYVHFVDELNRPKTLWLIFSMIGVATIIGLMLFNKFMNPALERAESASK